MPIEFTKLINEIAEWQDKIFTEATPLSAAIHLQREVRELVFDLTSGNPKSMRLELADVFFLLVAVAHLSGVELEEAVLEKFEINKKRVWGKPDAEGVVEHVRELPKGATLLEVFQDNGLLEGTENVFSRKFFFAEDKGDENGQVQAD